MARQRDEDAGVLERGNLYFLYRPKVQEEQVAGLGEVERLFMVLKPDGADRYRLAVIGRKRLPDVEEHERNWGFIDRVANSASELEDALQRETYETRTRGERVRPPARPAGESVYALVRKGRNLHLAYALELPETPGPVQQALKIGREGTFVLSVKNPEQGSPPGAGRPAEEKAEYPPDLQREFGNRRFAPADPRRLDYEGAEFVLIGAAADVQDDLGVTLQPEHETANTADLLKQLRLQVSEHPVEPLLKGEWR